MLWLLVNNKFDMFRNEVDVAYSKYNPGIYLGEIRKTKINLRVAGVLAGIRTQRIPNTRPLHQPSRWNHFLTLVRDLGLYSPLLPFAKNNIHFVTEETLDIRHLML